MRPSLHHLLLASAIALALAGCASKKAATADGAAIEERGGTTAAAGIPDSEAGGAGKDRVVARSLGDGGGRAGAGGAGASAGSQSGADDLAGAPSARQIFFDLDQYTIKPEYQDVVQAAADFLKNRSKVRVIIQGHTDERGSREYNLSLGQKRAESVRRALGVLGVGEDRIESVSFGEEKPLSECHEESCWAKNRRADIVFQSR